LKQPILSICIPTYNHSLYLKVFLDSIVNSSSFISDDVEIIISNNASTDDTEEVCQNYCKTYKNIYYYKNETNVRDQNFPIVLSKAHGIYRKVCNDRMLFESNTINEYITIIKNNIDKKPFLFFQVNCILDNSDIFIRGSNINEFLHYVNFDITNIGSFGLWEQDCNNILNTLDDCKLQLWQISFALNQIIEKKAFLICTKKIVTYQDETNKNISYGLFKVFYTNYFDILQRYVEKQYLSQQSFEWMQKDILYNFFYTWLLRQNSKSFVFSKSENLKHLIINEYKDKPYFNDFMKKLKKALFLQKVNNVKQIIKKMIHYHSNV
jgi:abequosyltransferase